MNIVQTATQKMELRDDGIVHVVVLNEKVMELNDAIENVKIISSFAGDSKVHLLIDLKNTVGATKECRAFLAGPETAKVQSACALIITSPFAKLIGSFFLGVNKPLFPTKLFTDPEKAEKWISQYARA